MKKTSPKIYIETYGCQMNVADSEVVVSIMQKNGFTITDNIENAEIILINTCSIRDNAEQRVWGRLHVFKQQKKKNPGLLIGVIGCMAERIKDKLLEETKMVDLVAGPDSYRDLPNLLNVAGAGHKAINILLSAEETYADINPVRFDSNGVSAFVSIMRGCNNMCAYCVVPYTRGRERSRDPKSIMNEIDDLIDNGYHEVTLLGQNVNSYYWKENEKVINFLALLALVAQRNQSVRIRFATSHPKDLSDELLFTMAKYDNICKHIHLPVQSGSSKILTLMNRGYSREQYLNKIDNIHRILPGCSITTDIIAGFCSETDEDHQQTLSLMRKVSFDFAYMFKYSERPGTSASGKLKDDIPDEIKSQRLTEIIKLQNKLSADNNNKEIGKIYNVLIEGTSKKSVKELFGRTSHNKVVIFPHQNIHPGDYAIVRIIKSTQASLIGELVNSSIS